MQAVPEELRINLGLFVNWVPISISGSWMLQKVLQLKIMTPKVSRGREGKEKGVEGNRGGSAQRCP